MCLACDRALARMFVVDAPAPLARDVDGASAAAAVETYAPLPVAASSPLSAIAGANAVLAIADGGDSATARWNWPTQAASAP